MCVYIYIYIYVCGLRRQDDYAEGSERKPYRNRTYKHTTGIKHIKKMISLKMTLYTYNKHKNVFKGYQGFQRYGLSVLRIRYFVPRMCVCDVFSCLAILRVEGCLNSTL